LRCHNFTLIFSVIPLSKTLSPDDVQAFCATA